MKKRRLANGDIELLELLWRIGEATIQETHRALESGVGYTTVQTRLNRLVAKKLASKSTDRPAKYRAEVGPDDISRSDLDVLVQQVNGGKIVPLVAHLVNDRLLSPEEIAELKELIANAENRQQKWESKQERPS